MKDLPAAYDTFCTIISQRDTPMAYLNFKVALKNFVDNEKFGLIISSKDDNVMKTYVDDIEHLT